MNLLIVVVAYNRPESLSRCLSSLSNLKSRTDISVDICISIDHFKENEEPKKNIECVDVANLFDWHMNDKKVIHLPENFGLRRHILACGSLVKDYDALLMLEDDIVISPFALSYVTKSIDFFEADPNIGGFSLYNHKKNFLNNEPFHPILDGSDNYFLQIASSWGQFWTKLQWNQFHEWYQEIDAAKLINSNLPENIKNWPESSWLKYFIWYLNEKNKYFVYPRQSLSTNFTDLGTHNNKSNTLYQVSLLSGGIFNYRFCDLNTSISVYDSHFESMHVQKLVADRLRCKLNDVTVDFYGTKKSVAQYHLCAQLRNYRVIERFGLSYKSWELNVIYSASGRSLYIYDTDIRQFKLKNLVSILRTPRVHYLECNLTLRKRLKDMFASLKSLFS
ncbi:hypothetical protein [Shewanella sp. HL-SH2]|uniref:hypothetical protein n=1 Tax=Shewanella sp. HL-SH2 TaxID=3436238 RepID=UPI003EBF93AB